MLLANCWRILYCSKRTFGTFLGGDEALNQVQNELAESTNIVLITVCLTTPILGAIFTSFKKHKLRKDVSMMQRLKQTVFSGFQIWPAIWSLSKHYWSFAVALCCIYCGLNLTKRKVRNMMMFNLKVYLLNLWWS